MAQSAAAKVFATPELLEHILLEFAKAVKETEPHQSHSIDQAVTIEPDVPVKALYVLQRIDKTTQAVIMSSKKLRRFMWLDTLPNPTRDNGREIPKLLAPLFWLLVTMRRPHATELHLRDFDSDDTESFAWFSRLTSAFYFTGFPPPPSSTSETPLQFPPLSQAMLHPTAALRSLRVLRGADSRAAAGLYTGGAPVEARKMIRGWYCEEFKIDDTATLGILYEWHTKLLERSSEDHRTIIEHARKHGTKSGKYWRRVDTPYGLRMVMPDDATDANSDIE